MKVSQILGLGVGFGTAVLCAAGCNVFDKNLIEEQSAASGNITLADDCVGTSPPVLASSNEFRNVDTSNDHNDHYSLSCTGGVDANGNDGFFAVEMQKGKKWHVHVKVTPGTDVDPVVYVLDSACQDSVCQRGWGLNECGPGQDEHFSFFPPHDGTYFYGIDSVAPGGEAVQVLAVQPVCGNGVKEHSETCDDGNVVSLDGCDAQCRVELTDSMAEVEPNDEPLANANVVLFQGQPSARVTGSVGGKCDFDSFAITLAQGQGLSAQATSRTEAQCGIATRLQIIDSDGLTPLVTQEAAAGACPSVDKTALGPGLFYVRIAPQTQAETGVLDYQLSISITG